MWSGLALRDSLYQCSASGSLFSLMYASPVTKRRVELSEVKTSHSHIVLLSIVMTEKDRTVYIIYRDAAALNTRISSQEQAFKVYWVICWVTESSVYLKMFMFSNIKIIKLSSSKANKSTLLDMWKEQYAHPWSVRHHLIPPPVTHLTLWLLTPEITMTSLS